VIGNSFFRLLLECILYWSKWFPRDIKKNDTKFKQTYDSLLKQGVKFPDQINYFKPKKPKNFEGKEMIKEEVIKEEYKVDFAVESILQNLASHKEFMKSLLLQEDQSQFEIESRLFLIL